ncbi:MAG: hypothetical protein R3C05_10000 [Pirellulaceae bacterium]
MRLSVARAVAIGLILLAKNASAQQTAEPSLILLTQCGRFHLVLGRIHLDSFHYKKVRLHRTCEHSPNDEEFVCVTANEATPSLHYLRQSGSTRVTIDTTQCDIVRIESKTSHSSGVQETLLIDQQATQPIQIVHAIGSSKRTFESTSFWHLMAQEPDWFDQHVRPLLSLMLHRCELQRSADAIQQRLKAQSQGAPSITQQFVDRQVERLASSSRSERIDAQRQLVSAGVGILPLLEQIDQRQLDIEQKSLIQKLERKLSSARVDTPDRVAAWLATDREYWILASRDWSSGNRQQAHEFMIATCGVGLDESNTSLARQNNQRYR